MRLRASLTLILLTWRIWRAPNNASRWQMGFNLAFKNSPSSEEFRVNNSNFMPSKPTSTHHGKFLFSLFPLTTKTLTGVDYFLRLPRTTSIISVDFIAYALITNAYFPFQASQMPPPHATTYPLWTSWSSLLGMAVV